MGGKRKAGAATTGVKQKTIFDHFKKVPPKGVDPALNEVIDIPATKPTLPPSPVLPTPIIDLTLESPARPARVAQLEKVPVKQTYSIFNRPPKGIIVEDESTSSAPSITPILSPTFPTGENQHVRGLQTTFSASPFPSRLPSSDASTLPENSQWSKGISDARHGVVHSPRILSSSEERRNCLEAISQEHKQRHPAIASLVDATIESSPPPEHLWSDRWHPRRAADILGNEENAAYLRDWLQALEVRFDVPHEESSRGIKRPQIKRSVTRPRKRQRQSLDEFEWIVSDASDYSEPETYDGGKDDDEFEPGDGTLPEHGPFDKNLTNTILLHGPSGSGKTAAVYACAEELDWEVFEVHPGIGKRNGASLEALIGEVGKNHLVRRTGRKKGEQETDFGFIIPQQDAGARQSLILLEEVDILYRDDANFWPAVIRLIKDCKRPIILTCNDISLVPVDELPLQTTLNFAPCPPEEAGTYLQALCCSAGYVIEQDRLRDLYSNTLDLRRSIQHLHLGHETSVANDDTSDLLLDWTSATKRDVRYADTLSFMDSCLTRNGKPAIFAESQWLASGDDEIGHPIVTDADQNVFGLYDLDQRIVAAVTRHGQHGRARVGSEYARLIDKMREHRTLGIGVIERLLRQRIFWKVRTNRVDGERELADVMKDRWK
ncbi:AAA family protein [Mycena indigotica]|uniref:AAA family protein n=1 Tax=Mycena indigotica TaxID=2126181 RepID=A0A8H6SLP0_9AGAR|nr:AAA family protein [Mycena indigotica]KAF7301701.1 AAA family protein [Mycena indigotica]